jgi:hypothetical protein
VAGESELMRVVVVDAVASSGRILLEALAQHRYIDHVISVGDPSLALATSGLRVEVVKTQKHGGISQTLPEC